MNKLWTIGSLLQWTQQYFSQKGIESPRLDAEILLSHVLQKERIYLYAHYDEPMNPQELAAYREMVKQRASRLSVAHILGTRAFMGLDFHVSTDVLIPRPETELLVETALEMTEKDKPISILDIGTGSGAILISLLYYLPQAVGIGADVSAKALEIARENGSALGVAERVQWLESDLFSHVAAQSFDWVISNPPYLTAADMQQLQPEVRHDPALALFGGTDGLDVYRRLAKESPMYVKKDGYMMVEIGAGQTDDVITIFTQDGWYTHIKTIKDYGGVERVILFSRKERM